MCWSWLPHFSTREARLASAACIPSTDHSSSEIAFIRTMSNASKVDRVLRVPQAQDQVR